MLKGKKVLLGVSASIAAYKSAFIVREFIKQGAEVRVVLTPASLDFVTPLTLSTLSKNEVHVHFTDPDNPLATWNNHVELGLWADIMVIAPATSTTLSKMANGVADNLLLATYMSAKCPVYFAPAMDLDMYKHPATKANIAALQSFGNAFIPPGSGELASGLEGEGRLAEPHEIVVFISNDLKAGKPLSGKKVLINAGPTHEPIDAVRFIGNHSTGQMGVALANRAQDLGATVHLVLGPTQFPLATGNYAITKVTTAAEMLQACDEAFDTADVTILSAAVADYRPISTAPNKMKKGQSELTIALAPTQDILATLGAKKKTDQLLVGFALETDNELNYAMGKLEKKNLDAIILNSLNDKGAGFGHATNKVTLIDRQKNILELPLQTKNEVAKEIWQFLLSL